MAGELYLELVCRAGSAAEFARVAKLWLTEARAEIFPEYSAGLPAEPVLTGVTEKDPDAAWGPPGVVYGQIMVERESATQASYARYSSRSWKRLMSGLEPGYPVETELWMFPLDDDGRPAGGAEAPVTVGVHRLHERPEWVRLIVEAPMLRVPWLGSETIQNGWIDFLRRWAERVQACYGHISDDSSSLYGTSLERASGADLEHTIPQCREVLRGYSWVTLCAPGIVERLGGAEALVSSGVFHEVSELPGGQVLLRATPMLEQYEGITVTHVFEALARVLLTGKTEPDFAHPGMRLAIGVDAVDFR